MGPNPVLHDSMAKKGKKKESILESQESEWTQLYLRSIFSRVRGVVSLPPLALILVKTFLVPLKRH